jgi:predicted metalloendopeptidase
MQLKTTTAVTIALVLAAAPALTADSARPTKPVYGSWGLDYTAMDKSVKPGDDFFGYMNGRWLKTAPIPSDRTYNGIDVAIDETLKPRLRGIVEAAAQPRAERTPSEQRIGDLYASYLDEKTIAAKGIEPIRADLAAIDGLKANSDLPPLLARLSVDGAASPINGYRDIDARNPTRYLFRFVQSGLSFSDRDYYLKDTTEFKDLRAKFRAHVEKILKLAGFADAASQADRVLAFETKIAQAHWPLEKARDDELTYNLFKRGDFDAKAPGFAWAALLSAAKLDKFNEFLVSQPDTLAAVAKLVGTGSLDDWKAYLRYHVVVAYASYLPKAFEDEEFDFYRRIVRGQKVQEPRWKRGINLVDGLIGEAMGRVYVGKFFPAYAKADMQQLVSNFKIAFAKLVDKATWMSASTRAEAHKKLQAFVAKLGYPDKWRDYSSLTIARDDLAGNVRRAYRFQWEYDLGKLAGPIDRGEWFMTPQTNNAYYNPTMNEICFPAGILMPPYFDPAADLASNYGEIGATIGHEMSHGFDDQGRKYDWKGVMRDWWTKEDAARYTSEANKLVVQYAKFSPVQGLHLNGQQTLGENIADLAGLIIAYEAYKLALGGKEAPVIDGLTGDQRFFLSYAQSWKTKYTPERLRDMTVSNVHSPAEYRVNGVVRNFDAWYAAFNVKPGDKLYLPPAERARPW